MRNVTSALMTGDPHETGMMAGMLRQLFSGILSRP
jgi:pyruvate dehydrogenase (quinone)